jgi:hypothetical protein
LKNKGLLIFEGQAVSAEGAPQQSTIECSSIVNGAGESRSSADGLTIVDQPIADF